MKSEPHKRLLEGKQPGPAPKNPVGHSTKTFSGLLRATFWPISNSHCDSFKHRHYCRAQLSEQELI